MQRVAYNGVYDISTTKVVTPAVLVGVRACVYVCVCVGGCMGAGVNILEYMNIHLWHFFQREARRHFGCPTLNGMELENLGGSGTRYSHWKKRLVDVSYNPIS